MRLHTLLLLLALCTSCREASFTHGDLKIDLDDRMYWRVESLAAGVAPFGDGFTPAGTIEASEASVSDFTLTDLHKTEGGGNLRLGKV